MKKILNECYGIKEAYIIDNKLSKFNSNIKHVSYLREVNIENYTILLSTINMDLVPILIEELKKYTQNAHVINIFFDEKDTTKQYTERGKYSYGPLCNHVLVKKVGAFCSFAAGTDVVPNHAVKYISTHLFLAIDKVTHPKGYENYKEKEWYLPGVKPKAEIGIKKSIIGNDVWIGKNVTIISGVNIGNGVIAGAGAVITRDVPDYAVVVGVPARIIKYRFSTAQIEKLNEIAWWNWSDEKIRKYHDDFYLSADDFINRHLKMRKGEV